VPQIGCSLSRVIFLTGHTLAQVPQPEQWSLALKASASHPCLAAYSSIGMTGLITLKKRPRNSKAESQVSNSILLVLRVLITRAISSIPLLALLRPESVIYKRNIVFATYLLAI